MIQKLAEKICEKIDSSPRIQKFMEITPREEKIAKRLAIPAIAACAAIVFLMASAESEAAQPDPKNFFTIHEIKPILSPKRDADGQPINVINQIDLLVQLPGERVARRMRVPLQDTIFLDPRAPAPGERRYEAVIGLDGQIEANGRE